MNGVGKGEFLPYRLVPVAHGQFIKEMVAPGDTKDVPKKLSYGFEVGANGISYHLVSVGEGKFIKLNVDPNDPKSEAHHKNAGRIFGRLGSRSVLPRLSCPGTSHGETKE